eukprot:TRINITY_DN2249_c0_g1_i1.p1 TRINITY_DN2249_c0_g1~~TRINITY_DN2249_c0_g1_i1.p1  ORF type:complete len:178 (+),score=50.33 TRINITY_DN2249_c0_g1_i1:851-1384(+)
MSGTDNLKQRTVGPMEVEAGEEKAKLKGEEILDPVSASERRHKKVEKAFTWIWNKIQSAMWVTGAVAVIYYSNFFKVIFDSPRANRIFVNIALLGIGINVTLTIYVAFILPHVLKIKESFETYCPRVVVIGTISGVTSFITMIIGIWPLWGLSLIHISEPTRQAEISYAVFCLKKKN